MKTPSEIVATLRDRDLEDLADQVARRHGVKLLEICSDAKYADCVEARHAVWYALAKHFGGNESAVARVWGCDRSSISSALRDYPGDIVRVLLDRYPDTESPWVELVWVSGRLHPFGIFDRACECTEWFATWESARNLFRQACESFGAPTFRSVSSGTPAPAALPEGGA